MHLHLLASGPHLFTTLHPLNWHHILFPCGKLFSEWASRCHNFHLHYPILCKVGTVGSPWAPETTAHLKLLLELLQFPRCLLLHLWLCHCLHSSPSSLFSLNSCQFLPHGKFSALTRTNTMLSTFSISWWTGWSPFFATIDWGSRKALLVTWVWMWPRMYAEPALALLPVHNEY